MIDPCFIVLDRISNKIEQLEDEAMEDSSTKTLHKL
jgi:hypothetical protein